MNGGLNKLVGASERKNKRKNKTVVRATRGSEVNVSKDALEGGGTIKLVARRNSKININNPVPTPKVAKSIKPAKANVVAATPKPKTTAGATGAIGGVKPALKPAPKKPAPKRAAKPAPKRAAKPARKPARKPAATVPKKTFVPTKQKLPITKQDNTKVKPRTETNHPRPTLLGHPMEHSMLERKHFQRKTK